MTNWSLTSAWKIETQTSMISRAFALTKLRHMRRITEPWWSKWMCRESRRFTLICIKSMLKMNKWRRITTNTKRLCMISRWLLGRLPSAPKRSTAELNLFPQAKISLNTRMCMSNKGWLKSCSEKKIRIGWFNPSSIRNKSPMALSKAVIKDPNLMLRL